jgi:hypothetical protein
MRHLLVILFILNTIIAFGQTKLKADSLLTNEELLAKLLPEIIEFNHFLNLFEFHSNSTDSIELNNRYPYLKIGKFIDSIQTFAINCNLTDSSIQFYRLLNDRWKKIGYEIDKDIEYISEINFQNIDWTEGNEIVTSTGANMNGNSWYKIYKYNLKSDSIHFAGEYCCQDSLDFNKKRIYEYHEGSWYMDLYKTIYIWNKDTLIPLRHVRLTLTHGIWTLISPYKILYFENPDLGYSTKYKLVFKQFYFYKKHRKYWDDFYEIK